MLASGALNPLPKTLLPQGIEFGLRHVAAEPELEPVLVVQEICQWFELLFTLRLEFAHTEFEYHRVDTNPADSSAQREYIADQTKTAWSSL